MIDNQKTTKQTFHYSINYDLNEPSKDYTNLEKALKKLDARKMLKTSWQVTTELTLTELCEYLFSSKGIDKNDDLVINEIKEPSKKTQIYNAPNFTQKSEPTWILKSAFLY